jgi:hypothetical protein
MKDGIRGDEDLLGGEDPAALDRAGFGPFRPLGWEGIDEPAMTI